MRKELIDDYENVYVKRSIVQMKTYESRFYERAGPGLEQKKLKPNLSQTDIVRQYNIIRNNYSIYFKEPNEGADKIQKDLQTLISTNKPYPLLFDDGTDSDTLFQHRRDVINLFVQKYNTLDMAQKEIHEKIVQYYEDIVRYTPKLEEVPEPVEPLYLSPKWKFPRNYKHPPNAEPTEFYRRFSLIESEPGIADRKPKLHCPLRFQNDKTDSLYTFIV